MVLPGLVISSILQARLETASPPMDRRTEPLTTQLLQAGALPQPPGVSLARMQ
jgi:hypothetical protein